MTDPISGAIAGSVANVAIEKIVNYIEGADNPEKAWKRSALEVAIQAEAAYRQEVLAGRLYDKDSIQRQINRFGELSQQLAIRGELRGFDEDFIELLEEFAYGCGDFADAPGGVGTTLEPDWDDNVEKSLDEIKDTVDVE